MTPWPSMMRAALIFGLRPDAFWRLSLKEWRMLTEQAGGPAAMGRGEFERLAKAWPDE